MAFVTSLVLLLCVVIGGLYVFLSRFKIEVDPREPPLVSPTIPVIGHAIGLLRHGVGYWVHVYDKCHQPIFTAGLLRKKFYIVTSLDIFKVVQRSSRTVSFSPFVTMTADKLSGLHPEQVKVFRPNNGRKGLAEETITGVERVLHQSDVDDITISALKYITKTFNELPKSRPEKLHAFIRHIVTCASTDGIYGSDNPFNDPAIEKAFWTFEETATVLLNGFLPSLKARRSVAARDTVARAFTKYYANNGHEKPGASRLAYEKWAAPSSYSLGSEQIARIEVPFLIGVLNNSVATTFWVLACVLTSPNLLSRLRDEISTAITSGAATVSGGDAKHTIHLDRIKASCPLLLSTYHETLRTRTSFATCRFVTDDTFISDPTNPDKQPYLLRAGSLLQAPVDIIHNSPEYWGPRATDSDPARFIDPANKKANPLAFCSFGSAPFICPGRQFATGEVLAIAAMIISRFDILPVEDGEELTMPVQNVSMFGAVPPPKGDIEVKFCERKGWEGDWEVVRGEPGIGWGLESG